jgi:predicted transcriptional regulator
LSSKLQQQIEWRRNQVLELSSKGHSGTEIAKILHVDKSLVSRGSYILKTESTGKSKVSYPIKTTRRISTLSNRNESGIEIKLANC